MKQALADWQKNDPKGFGAIAHSLQLLMERGKPGKTPRVRSSNKYEGLFELKPQGDELAPRLFFFYVPNDLSHAIVVHHFTKKSARTSTERENQTAEQDTAFEDAQRLRVACTPFLSQLLSQPLRLV